MEDMIKSKKVFNKIKGDIGEEQASLYLKQLGYKIIKRNFKTKLGEIDIIAKDGERIVFVEVKKKTTLKFGMPREMVTLKKQKTIKSVAELYLKITKNLSCPTRFDVIEIVNDDITHLKAAF